MGAADDGAGEKPVRGALSAGMAELAAGERLNGRFMVEALAARGGMGSVYRARDLASGELVALKLLDDQRSPARFTRESTVLSDLCHPAVVRYVAHGETQAGQAFLVMEWLAGEDLAERLRREGLSVSDSLALLRRVCEGLAAAHARGVVHRDIKPSNLVLVAGAPGAVKVVDFGLVRLMSAEQTLTRAGGLLGTVGYMAPEQAMGAYDVDARADVFALGCVLFECLTGRPAFVGQHEVAVLAKLLREDPPPVSELRPELGRGFDALLQRMLAKERDQRPRDAAALLQELAALGEPSGAAPPAQLSEAARLTRSEQRIVSAILGRTRESATATLAPELADAEASRLQALSERFAAEPVPLPGGGLLFLMSSQGAATDLARRAARCSLALQQLRSDLSLAVATGSVDTSGRIPVGVAIDRAAAALSEHSGGPGVALDEATSGLLGPRFELRRSPSGVFLLGEVEQADDRPRLLMGKPTPHVGRDKELALLEATLAECRGDGVARAVLVTGQPGIGKSRLGLEFVARVREQSAARMLLARADPIAAGAALSLVQRLVRHAAGLREGDATADQHARLRAYLVEFAPGDACDWLAEFLSELLALPVAQPSPLLRAARNDPEVMREQNRRVFLRWLEAEVARSPLVILLEDLHWGDQATLTYLDDALRKLDARPIMVVATARPEVHQLFPRLTQHAAVHEIRLGGLTRRAAERLALAALPEGTRAEVIERILRLADGNAFYLEELIRRVAEGGTDLPETVLAMAQSRLELLEPAARRVLRAASVFGETFWSGALGSLLGAAADQDACLEFLADREIVVRRHVARFPHEREYAFRHALLRDAAYAMLTSDDCKAAHRLAGEWLERAGEREALVLADHFERGGAAGRAVPWLLRAAHAALDSGDFASAASLARRGLALGPSGADHGALLLVHAYANAFGLRTDLQGLADALRLLPASSADWWLALSLLIFGAAAVGKPEDAKPYLQLALETPPGPELTGTYGAAMQALAAGMVLMGRADAAWPLIHRFEHVTPADPSCDLLFLAWLNLARCQLAVTSPVHGSWQLERALVWGREAEAVMRSAGSASGRVTALFYLGNAARIVGAYAEAEQALRECERLALKLGNALLRQYSQLILSLVLIRRGRSVEADELLCALRASPDANIEHGARAIAAEARLGERDFEAALAAALDAVDGPASPYRRMAHSTLARTYLALQRPDAALASAQQALGEGAAANPEFEADLLATQAQALLALERAEEARTVLAKARAFVRGVADGIGDAELRRAFLGELEGTVRVLALAREQAVGDL